MATADLYLKRMDFERYFPHTYCARCGLASCKDFLRRMRAGLIKPEVCVCLSREEIYAFEVVRKMSELWPDVPLLVHPRRSFVGLMELNEPNKESLILLTGNNEFTQQVLMTVLGTTVCPFFVLCVDTDGDTVDMSMVHETLTCERIRAQIVQTDLEQKSVRKEIIIPGLAAPLKDEIEKATGWRVRVGPLCAAELPLFLSDIWLPP
ncbi:MAG: hypothetical protein AB1442_07605 [Nitrospirota bacterium]